VDLRVRGLERRQTGARIGAPNTCAEMVRFPDVPSALPPVLAGVPELPQAAADRDRMAEAAPAAANFLLLRTVGLAPVRPADLGDAFLDLMAFPHFA
jgi:hypothetical protein